MKYHLSISIPEFLHQTLCQITLESNLPSGGNTRNIYMCLPISRTNREGCTNKRELKQAENWVATSNFLKPNTVWVLLPLLNSSDSSIQLLFSFSGKPRKIHRNSQTIRTLRLESEAFWPHTLLLHFKTVLWILLQWFQNAGGECQHTLNWKQIALKLFWLLRKIY